MPTIWPVLRFPDACWVSGATVGDGLEVMNGSDSPGRVLVVGIDVSVEDRVEDEDEGEGGDDGVGDGEGGEAGGGGADSETEGIGGASVALAMPVASTPVESGGLMAGGRAEENAFESGANCEVAIGTTVRESCVGLIA